MATQTITPFLGYEQEAVSTSGTSTLTPPDGASFAVIQAEGCNVRYRADGTAPTTSVGMRLDDGKDMMFTGTLGDIEFIAVSGSGVVNVAYYGNG